MNKHTVSHRILFPQTKPIDKTEPDAKAQNTFDPMCFNGAEADSGPQDERSIVGLHLRWMEALSEADAFKNLHSALLGKYIESEEVNERDRRRSHEGAERIRQAVELRRAGKCQRVGTILELSL